MKVKLFSTSKTINSIYDIELQVSKSRNACHFDAWIMHDQLICQKMINFESMIGITLVLTCLLKG